MRILLIYFATFSAALKGADKEESFEKLQSLSATCNPHQCDAIELYVATVKGILAIYPGYKINKEINQEINEIIKYLECSGTSLLKEKTNTHIENLKVFFAFIISSSDFEKLHPRAIDGSKLWLAVQEFKDSSASQKDLRHTLSNLWYRGMYGDDAVLCDYYNRILSMTNKVSDLEKSRRQKENIQRTLFGERATKLEREGTRI